MKAFLKKKLMMSLPIIIGALLIVGFLAIRVTNIFGKSEMNIITSSTLMEVVDIAELSTAKFYYNGIAEVKDGDKVKCYVRYDSEVTAGIEMKDITYDIDYDNKIIKPKLPKVRIIDNTLVGKQYILPENSDVDMVEIRKICKADSKKESEEASELFAVAEENLKYVVEGLLQPLTQTHGYTISWE